MTKRWVSQVVNQADGFHQVLVGTQCTRNGAAYLGYLQGVGKAGTVVIPFIISVSFIHSTNKFIEINILVRMVSNDMRKREKEKNER